MTDLKTLQCVLTRHTTGTLLVTWVSRGPFPITLGFCNEIRSRHASTH